MTTRHDNKFIIFILLIVLQVIVAAVCIRDVAAPHPSFTFDASNLQMQGGSFSEDGVFTIDESSGIVDDTVLSTGKLSLPAGVYEVHLEFDTEEEQITEVCSNSLGYHGLLSNAVTMRINTQMDQVTYRFTLNRDASDVEIIVRYLGSGVTKVSAFTLRDTGLTMAKVLVWFVPLALLLDLLIWLFLIRKYTLSTEQKQLIVVLFAVTLLSSIPNLVDYMRTGDDVYFHMNRIAGLAEAWRAGQFPARIQYWWLYGAGYPISVMYGDFFLWIPAFFHLCGYDLPQSYLMWIILWNAVTALIAYRSFRGMFQSHRAGLLGSILYTLSLYRIYNVHIRVAIGEYTAMTFLPLAAYGFVLLLQEARTAEEKKRGSVVLALAYSGMLLSHVLTLEIAVMTGTIVCLVNAKHLFRKETIIGILKAAALAVGLTAWFLVPFADYFLHVDMGVFHVEREIQKFGLMIPQFLTIFPWMGTNTVFHELGMHAARPAAAGAALLAGFAYVCLQLRLHREEWISHPHRRIMMTGIGTALIASVMTLNLFPWDAFQSLSDTTYRLGASLQFPWRLLMLVTIAMCIVCVAYVEHCHKSGYPVKYFTVLLISGVILTSMFLMNHDLQIRPISTMREASCMGADVMGAREYLIDGTIYELLDEVHFVAGDGVAVEDYTRTAGVVTAVVHGADTESTLEVPLMNYPHITAIDTTTGETLEITSTEQHLVCVTIPAGYEGTIRVALTEPWYWRAGEIVTVLTLLGCAFYCGFRRRSGTMK